MAFPSIELKPRWKPSRRYSSFYQQTRKFPEFQRFRRFTGEWAWALDCQLVEIHELERECKTALAKCGELPIGGREYSLMDWKPPLAKSKEVKRLMVKYHNSLRNYSKDLILVHQVAMLPDPSESAAQKVRNEPSLYEDGIFGLTGEGEERYKKRPCDPDLCSPKAYPDSDLMTVFVMEVCDLLIRKVWMPLMNHRKDKNDAQEIDKGNTDENPYINLLVLASVLDYVMCVFIPLLLTTLLFCVFLSQSTKVRIPVVGMGAIIFNLCFKIAARPRRFELYVVCASFFAFASVFVTVTSNKNG